MAMTGSYERIAAKLIKNQPKPRRVSSFIDGKVLTGYASRHLTAQSRMWRMFWRLKRVRSQISVDK